MKVEGIPEVAKCCIAKVREGLTDDEFQELLKSDSELKELREAFNKKNPKKVWNFPNFLDPPPPPLKFGKFQKFWVFSKSAKNT